MYQLYVQVSYSHKLLGDNEFTRDKVSALLFYISTSMLPVCDGLEDVVMFDLHGAVEVGTGEVTVALLGTLCSWFCVRMEPHVSN